MRLDAMLGGERLQFLVNAAYELQIPFKLDFTRFLRICASHQKAKTPKHGNNPSCRSLSDISNHYLLTRGYNPLSAKND